MTPPLRDQVPVRQVLPFQALHHPAHDVDGIGFPIIVSASELADIPIKVLFAEVVEGAVVAPLQHGSERLDPVGVRHPANVVTGGMANRLVVEGQPFVGAGIVGEHLGAGRRVLGNEALEGRLVGGRH